MLCCLKFSYEYYDYIVQIKILFKEANTLTNFFLNPVLQSPTSINPRLIPKESYRVNPE